mmetsp:Transcript_31038/g.27448  ORF Transcript_31038/g.27448 Transcript_31038/m.27448 type:complete len:91 (+) Transcript_31038:214-486(+)
MDESKSHSNTDPKSSTDCRNTMKTLNFNEPRSGALLDNIGNVYSLHAQFGDDNNTSPGNPSLISTEVNYGRKKRKRDLINDPCNSCCTIF